MSYLISIRQNMSYLISIRQKKQLRRAAFLLDQTQIIELADQAEQLLYGYQ